MSFGWVNIDNKDTLGSSVPNAGLTPDISVESQWITLFKFDKGELAEGKTIFEVELYSALPATTTDRPKDIQTRWLRSGQNPVNPTKRHTHTVGSIKSWASTAGGGLEDVTDVDDLPLEFQLWHNGKTTLKVFWIAKLFNPTAYLKDRIKVASAARTDVSANTNVSNVVTING